MKKLLWLGMALFIGGLFMLTSCEKPIAQEEEQVAEVQLGFVLPGMQKKDASPKDGKTPECVDEVADYVTIQLEDASGVATWYTLDLLALGDGTITEALKLPPGDYIVKEFYVFSDEDGDVDGSYPNAAAQGDYPAPDGMEYNNDVVMYASPYEGSYYDNLFEFTFNVPQKFTLKPFEKAENYIDVLCYEPAEWEGFGFKHWDHHAFEVREKCFFGDICTKFWEDFRDYESKENPYYGWPTHYDMYGIFEIVVQNPDRVDEAGTLIPGAITTSSNYPFDFENPAPVCVEYLDDLEVANEVYTFELWIYWPDGSKTLEHTGEFTDAQPNPFGWITDDNGEIIGGDGIWTWQVGDCGHPSNDIELILPALLYLPEEGKIRIETVKHNGFTYDYFDVRLLGTSWDANPLYPDELFEDALLPGWCGDLRTGISTGVYDVDVYSSLKPWTMPLTSVNGDGLALPDYPWDVLNYIANLNLVNPSPSKFAGQRLQSIIWLIIHGQDAATIADINAQGAGHTVTAAMIAEANALMADGAGFSPRTGDWSVVVMTPYRGDEKLVWYQFVLVRVDP